MHHKVSAVSGLRKRDNLSNVGLARKERDQPIKPPSDTAVWWCAIPKSFKYMTKIFADAFGRKPHNFKYFFQSLGVVVANRPPTNLKTIKCYIVLCSNNLSNITFVHEPGFMFGYRARKGVVGKCPSTLSGGFKKWKVCDPAEC